MLKIGLLGCGRIGQVHTRSFRALGTAIFCEKPVDMLVANIRAASKVVAASGVPFMTGFNRRFDPNFAVLRAHIGGGNHCLGLGHGCCQRLFHHDVLARPCRADRVVGVQRIGQRNIDCIHRIAGEERVVTIIDDNLRHAVKLRQSCALRQIVDHDGSDGGIAALGYAGHERLLGNPARADDCISDHGSLIRHKAQGAAGKSA